MSDIAGDAPGAYEQHWKPPAPIEGESLQPDVGNGDVDQRSETSGYLSGGEEVWWSEAESDSHFEYDSEEEERLLQQEWDASVRQFRTIISVVLLPYIGKFYGRRFGYYGTSYRSIHRPCLETYNYGHLKRSRGINCMASHLHSWDWPATSPQAPGYLPVWQRSSTLEPQVCPSGSLLHSHCILCMSCSHCLNSPLHRALLLNSLLLN